MDFKLKINNFEGPIDALLHMIEKRKLPINDISLAEVTDEYINFVNSLSEQNFSNSTHFIFVASTLTLIKSKSLLPKLELSSEEEGDIEELKKKIAQFKIYQSIASELGEYLKKKKTFLLPKARKRQISFEPTEQIQKPKLEAYLAFVFAEIPEKKSTKKEASIKIAVHIEEMMNSLSTRIQKELHSNFSSFIKSFTPKDSYEKKNERKVYKLVGFLAMLELVKNGILRVAQRHNFEEINIEKKYE